MPFSFFLSFFISFLFFFIRYADQTSAKCNCIERRTRTQQRTNRIFFKWKRNRRRQCFRYQACFFFCYLSRNIVIIIRNNVKKREKKRNKKKIEHYNDAVTNANADRSEYLSYNREIVSYSVILGAVRCVCKHNFYNQIECNSIAFFVTPSLLLNYLSNFLINWKFY